MTTPQTCVGLSELFDSTEWDDHERARLICGQCPVIEWCRDELEAHLRDAARVRAPGESSLGPPIGTRAGILFGYRGHKRGPAKCGTNSGYYRHVRTLNEDACDACKDAHSRYQSQHQSRANERRRQQRRDRRIALQSKVA